MVRIPHSGFLVALLDAIAFGATAGFYFFAGEIADRSWASFLVVLLAVAVWSLLTTFLFMLAEAKRGWALPHVLPRTSG